jgi:hypothetical protein
MGERGDPHPERLSPEEYKKAEGITEEVQKAHDAHAMDTEEMEEEKFKELVEKQFVHTAPIKVALDDLNRLALEQLGDADKPKGTEDTFNPKEGPYSAPEEPEPESAIDAMMPEHGRNQPAETDKAKDPVVEKEQLAAMEYEIEEGKKRYRSALLDANDLLMLKPRSETVQIRWKQRRGTNEKELFAIESEVESGRFIDPAVIRAKYDAAAERLIHFAEDADKSGPDRS